MRNNLSICRLVSVSLISIATMGGGLWGQNYPAPRYPKLPEVRSVEDLLPIARVVVRRPARRAFAASTGYGIRAGEKVLLVVPSTFNPLVRDALATAIREAGAQLDVVLLHASSSSHEHGLPPEGTPEAARMLQPSEYVGEVNPRAHKVLSFAEADRYDLLIEGGGGPVPVTPFRWERIPWDTIEKFVGSAGFPNEVQDPIDEKIWDILKKAIRVHVTDPEGTDLTWSVTPEGFDRASKEWGNPLYPAGTFDIVMRGHISLTPLFLATAMDAKGVVAGTINHAGVFPHTRLHVDEGKIVRVEGGGSYGETVSAVLKKYENVQWPGFPGKGAGWFIESALGTNPKVARVSGVTRGETMSWERGRSGVIHWGFGVAIPPGASFEKDYIKKVMAEKLTAGHVHIHTYFNTVDVEMRDGKKVRLVDKGRLTLLDDPEIRKIAARYGNPDELLQEAWIPAVPGINAPGKYEEYAVNPAMSVKLDVENIGKQK